jgi:RimJ/RimL family protein N-acetyltransferase
MTDLRHRLTGRLALDAVTADDLDEHFAILSDPGVWRHLPANRHTTRQRTAEGIERQVECWERTGLGIWTARLRSDLPADRVPPGLAPGAVVGMGGCAVPVDACWWNLYYRLTPPAWGHGLAAELVSEAVAAARRVDPELPVVAYLLEHNVESRGRAERSGLTLVWRGPDAGNPDPGAVRLVYTDRPVDDDVLARIAARP